MGDDNNGHLSQPFRGVLAILHAEQKIGRKVADVIRRLLRFGREVGVVAEGEDASSGQFIRKPEFGPEIAHISIVTPSS
jgi:hypothetical protein